MAWIIEKQQKHRAAVAVVQLKVMMVEATLDVMLVGNPSKSICSVKIRYKSCVFLWKIAKLRWSSFDRKYRRLSPNKQAHAHSLSDAYHQHHWIGLQKIMKKAEAVGCCFSAIFEIQSVKKILQILHTIWSTTPVHDSIRFCNGNTYDKAILAAVIIAIARNIRHAILWTK